MQKYVSQPNEQGLYEVARWNELNQKYEPLKIGFLPIPLEEVTIELAHILNEETSKD